MTVSRPGLTREIGVRRQPPASATGWFTNRLNEAGCTQCRPTAAASCTGYILTVRWSAPVAVAQFVYATTVTGRLYALDPDDGSIVWQAEVGGPVWTSPAVGRGRVYVGHSGGEVLAFDAASGRELWRYEVGEVIRASALSVGDLVVVGTMTGRLLVLRADDGSLVDSTRCRARSGRFAGVLTDRRLFVATQAGKILCFGDRDEQAEPARQRINAQLQPQ